MIHAIIIISVQSSGLGGMTHNTVMLAWPERWKTDSTWSQFIGNATPTNTGLCVHCISFTETVHVASQRELAVLVPKGINWYPSRKDKMNGSIDVWWIVRIL